VLRRASDASVPTGTVLARQGRAGASAFVIVTGCARLEQHGRTLAYMGPQSVVGELSLLDGGLSSVTVTATSRLELQVIERRAFLDVVAQHPDLLARVLEQLAARVRAAQPVSEWGVAQRYEPGMPPNMSTMREASS